MKKEGERESDLISTGGDQDSAGRNAHQPAGLRAAGLKAGLAGFGPVLISVLFLPSQDAVRWVLYAGVGVIAALLLPSPRTIARGVKVGAIAGLIASGLAFGAYFALLVTFARPFLEPVLEELYGVSRWSGFLFELALLAARNLLAAVALGSLAGAIVSVLRSGRGAP